MKKLILSACCGLALYMAAPLQGQTQQQGQSQQQGQQKPSGPTAQAQEEYNALQKISQETSNQAKIAQIDEFIKKYPQSRYMADVLFQKITIVEDPKARLPLIEEFLSKYQDSRYTPYVHQIASTTYMQQNQFEKMADEGEKALTGLPDDPNKAVLLTQLGNGYAEKQVKDKAEEKANKALALLQTAQKPPQMNDEQWTQLKNTLMGSNYSTLGFVHMQKGQAEQQVSKKKLEPLNEKIELVQKERDSLTNAKNFDKTALATKQSELEKLTAERDAMKKDLSKDGQTALNQAVELFNKAIVTSNKDDYSYYRLGFAYMLLNKPEESINSFAKAVALKGVASQPARKYLEDVYKAVHKNSLDGIDEVIRKAELEVKPNK